MNKDQSQSPERQEPSLPAAWRPGPRRPCASERVRRSGCGAVRGAAPLLGPAPGAQCIGLPGGAGACNDCPVRWGRVGSKQTSTSWRGPRRRLEAVEATPLVHSPGAALRLPGLPGPARHLGVPIVERRTPPAPRPSPRTGSYGSSLVQHPADSGPGPDILRPPPLPSRTRISPRGARGSGPA